MVGLFSQLERQCHRNADCQFDGLRCSIAMDADRLDHFGSFCGHRVACVRCGPVLWGPDSEGLAIDRQFNACGHESASGSIIAQDRQDLTLPHILHARGLQLLNREQGNE